jgi:hemolysin type calcium-binding protein
MRFRAKLPLAVALSLVPLVALPPSAQAVAPDYNVTITSGTSPQSWDGTIATGANANYDSQAGEPCGKTPADYCDFILLHVDVPPSFWATQGGGVQVDLSNYTPSPGSDFDLYVYASDASANRGPLAASSGNVPGEPESTTIREASGYYLIQVVYFAVTASRYTGTVTFVTRAKIPPDVDNPPGLQEFLASRPELGFRSHSEMHLAQSPLDPNLLVAASKFYNRDRDSLAEYEFKLGTYVSFDGGRTWEDLGQLAVCPLSQAPQSSWPNNTCYPEDDPNKGGTGPEDEDDPSDPADPADDRGSGDIAEEYIVSDPWLDFDDEGNAYIMALDSPPYPSGNGWGMSLHRWESVSAQDVASGNTWGPKILINAYDSDLTKELALDDKNTFTINNAGADQNGSTGTMISCWGQNIPQLVKQQIVCDRSTDGGRTWPGQPIPISGAEPLVIGVHVLADQQDPNTFYAVWLQYASQTAIGEGTLQFAKTTNGGQSWQPDTTITAFTPIPRTYPGQAFRNLSIPIMAVEPQTIGATKDLYVMYPEYRTAHDPNDADGMQADIMVVKSSNGGQSWGTPAKVNQDSTSADQFQPYVDITETGQVNVMYFDRRLDVASGTHPGNYFTDVFLSRSNDEGQTWTDARVTHDATDPEYNAPVSGSGLFFGDYQGLVADGCGAIPFVNDTHLANDELIDPGPDRDPEFDLGFPSSPYQEAVAWRVPNTTDLGGTLNQLPTNCLSPQQLAKQRDCPVSVKGVLSRIVGTDGDDTLVGTKGPDLICGLNGDDRIKGKGGRDFIFAGAGNDRGSGGGGKDRIRGHEGKDRLSGQGGRDRITGETGNDRLRGGGGRDKLKGGPGKDRLAGGGGRDRLNGGPAPDRCAGIGRDKVRKC